MKDTEKALLQQALASGNAETVNTTCRNILKNRLKWDDQPDRGLRFLLEDIVNKIGFPLSYTAEAKTVPAASKQNPAAIVLWLALALVGLWLCLGDAGWIRLIGFFLSAGGGLLAGLTIKRKPAPIPESPRLRISTTPDELEREVKGVYEALSQFYNYRQLEGRNIRILNWFQDLYSDDSTSKELKTKIGKLLSQAGYTFIDFTPDRSPDFELNTGNVEQPLTTVPALVNANGKAVVKGIAILPKMK